MSLGKNHIVTRIEELYRNREPLNISAVKRKHPELLQDAFDIQPFLGWKGALEIAGLSYDKINVEFQESVTCKICGHEFTAMSSHLKRIHGVSGTEYAEEFPGVELTAEVVRAKISPLNRGIKLFPHWEPAWSWQYAMDRMIECWRRGFPMNYSWMADHEKGLANKVIEFFGSWDAGLRRIGLEPKEIRCLDPGQHWDRQKVLDAIGDRRRQGLPLDHTTISNESNWSLLNAMSRLFGGVNKALQEGGVDPETEQLRPRRYGKDTIKELIEAVREAAGHPRPERIEKFRALKAPFNRMVCNSWEIGSWAAVITMAGLPSDHFKPLKPYPDKAAVIAEIHRRLNAGLSIGGGLVCKEDRPLYREVDRYFNGYKNMYQALGLPPSIRSTS